jgi:iron complex outermembrane receptor protein
LRYNKDNYIYIRSNPEVYHNIHETNVATAEMQATKTLTHGHMGAGLEWREEAIHSNSLGQRSRSNAGAFAEYAVDFTKRVSTGASVYINYNSDYGLKAYPALNAGYRINMDWKAFANAGISQRLPTYTDLYYKGPTNIGNAQLKPEEAAYAEGGIQYAHAATKLKGIYGYRHVTDFIDWVRADLQSPWQPQNFGTVNTQVLTIGGEQGMNELLGLPTGYQLSLHASWNYLVPDREGVEEVYSKYSTDALRHQAIAGMRATIASFGMGINVRYQNRMNAGDYTLADIHLQYEQPLWSIFADVTNIFDQAYTEISTVPLPGRWLCIGLRIKSR